MAAACRVAKRRPGGGLGKAYKDIAREFALIGELQRKREESLATEIHRHHASSNRAVVEKAGDGDLHKATLSMSGLGHARIVKNVYMAYLSAVILEPILQLEGGHVTPNLVAEETAYMFGIVYWMYLLIDTFDYSDCMQVRRLASFVDAVDQEPERYQWMRFRPRGSTDVTFGDVSQDAALWFQILTICAAWFGFTNRNVVHSIIIIILWVLLHRACVCATVWKTNYVESLFRPSKVLTPLQYCIPMMDVFGSVEELADLEDWVGFVKAQTGVSLTIVN